MCKVFSFSTKEEINELTQEEIAIEEMVEEVQEEVVGSEEDNALLDEFYGHIGNLAKLIQDKDNQEILIEKGQVQERTLELLKQVIIAVQVGY